MKLFLSADIEGTCGITDWEETQADKGAYVRYAAQMTREVSAACRGALSAGADLVFVKDGHDSARNIIPAELPRDTLLLRGWGRTPLSMMAGLDESFDGVLFTGYHSGAGYEGNPLSHTMNTKNNFVRINGIPVSELVINSMTAASMGVPVLMVSGDRALCERMTETCPWMKTVPVSDGMGSASISIHPDTAVERIEEAARAAVKDIDMAKCYPMPDHFTVEINYKDLFRAESAHWYPGCVKTDSRTVCYESSSWRDVLTMIHFVL